MTNQFVGQQVIGKCSICGGRVVSGAYSSSFLPSVPTCLNCGAKKEDDLPVLEMKKPNTKTLLTE